MIQNDAVDFCKRRAVAFPSRFHDLSDGTLMRTLSWYSKDSVVLRPQEEQWESRSRDPPNRTERSPEMTTSLIVYRLE